MWHTLLLLAFEVLYHFFFHSIVEGVLVGSEHNSLRLVLGKALQEGNAGLEDV